MPTFGSDPGVIMSILQHDEAVYYNPQRNILNPQSQDQKVFALKPVGLSMWSLHIIRCLCWYSHSLPQSNNMHRVSHIFDSK